MAQAPVPESASVTTRRDFPFLALYVAVCLPGIFAGLVLYAQRLPYPYQDDYKSLIAFACQLVTAPSLHAKLALVTLHEFNSYRLIFLHGILAVEIASTHHLNFGFLTAFGDLFLAGIACLLWCASSESQLKTRLLYFLPVSLTFFSLTYWETLNWAMPGLQNIPVIFFALLSLYLLGSGKSPTVHPGRFFLSCIAALLACCTSPNGFLLAPVGILMLVPRRRHLHIILWLCSFILPLTAYLYRPVTNPAAPVSHLKQLFYFVAFFGGVAGSRAPAFLVGLVVLAVFVWAARSKHLLKNPVLFPFAVWIVLTGALIEAVRVSIPSRYSIYSVLMFVCCYRFLLSSFDQVTHSGTGDTHSGTGKFHALLTRNRFLAASIAGSLLLYTASAVWASRHLHQRRELVLKGLRFYRANPIQNSPQANPVLDVLFPDETPTELRMLHCAAQNGLYVVPPAQDLQP